jgi:cholesterol transport system auxiliary component
MTKPQNISRRALLRGALTAGALTAGGGLMGCTVLSNVNTPVPLYNLRPQITFDTSLPKVDTQLVVSVPNADADLDTARIALRRSTGVTEYFANAAWTDNGPNLIQSKLIEAFEKTNSVAVGRDVAGLIPDFVLQSELRDFQAEYENGSFVGAHIRLTAKLVRMSDRKIISIINAEQKVKASGTDILQVVAAFEAALAPVLKQIVTETLKAMQAG